MSKFTTNTSNEGQLIDGRFQVCKKIGSGAFGALYIAQDIESGLKCAIKFELLSCRCPMIPLEYSIYQTIGNEIGFPKCLASGKTETENYLVMTLLNKDLKELFEKCGKRFSLKTVLYIAIQTITRMEVLHSKNYIYRDIKPENFMIGMPETEVAKIVHLIDFGTIKMFIEPTDNGPKHIQFRDGKQAIGTARYASCNAHFGYELSRRDDLESLAYMFLLFLKGNLPWSGLMANTAMEQFRKIGSMKQAMTPEQLFDGYPSEFADYLTHVRNLKFDETPDYETHRRNFFSLFEKLNLVDDGLFDWDTKSI